MRSFGERFEDCPVPVTESPVRLTTSLMTETTLPWNRGAAPLGFYEADAHFGNVECIPGNLFKTDGYTGLVLYGSTGNAVPVVLEDITWVTVDIDRGIEKIRLSTGQIGFDPSHVVFKRRVR